MADTVLAAFLNTVEKRKDAPAARFKNAKGEWESVSWGKMGQDRLEVAAALVELGVKAKDRINVIANTSYKWMLADVGIQSAGATVVAIYQSNLPHEVEYIVNDSGGTLIIAENREQLDKLLKEKAKLTKVRKVIVMSDETDGTDWTMSWSDFVSLGRSKVADHTAELNARQKALSGDDVLCLIYTSGTTGMPKGVVLTQRNLGYEVEATSKIDLIREDDLELLFLPMAHSFARVLQCIWLGKGHEMAIDADLQAITANMGAVKPTIMASVPRIFEKVYAKVTAGGLEAPGIKGKLFKWALDVNDQYTQHMVDGKSVPFGLELQLGLARKLVFSKVGERLKGIFGGRIRYFVSGGAPLSRKIAYFFSNAGVTILEGYGLTETSAATCVNRPDKVKIGTVGPTVPGTEIKIAADGEILIKGPGVMREYWGKPEATKEVISADGWFSTGDIGVVDQDGFVKITDRKKDIIVTAGGKNVAPQNIENLLKASSPLISQVMIYGDKRKYLVAIVTVEPENLANWAKENGVSGDYKVMSKSEKLRQAIQGIIDHANGQLAQYESIKKFHILDKDFEIGDELTPTLKVKRKHASQKYIDILESMYDEKLVD